MTQSRDNFYRLNPELNYLQQAVYTSTGVTGTIYRTIFNQYADFTRLQTKSARRLFNGSGAGQIY